MNYYASAYIVILLFFFFNDTATTEIYTLSLHDALPISSTSTATPSPSAPCSAGAGCRGRRWRASASASAPTCGWSPSAAPRRSEEHTSELQSRQYLVCRLLLEKKKKISQTPISTHVFHT